MAKLLATLYGYCTECNETFEYNVYEDKEDGNFTDISRGEFLVHGEHMGIGYKSEADAQVAMETQQRDDLEEALSFNPNLFGWEALINCLIEEQAEATTETTETANTMDKAVKPMAGKQHAGNNKFLAAMKAWHTRHSSLGKMTVTAKNNYSSLVELINRTSEAKAIEFALMRAYGKRDELEAWLIEAGVVAAPTSAETAPEAANAAPVERAGVGDAFYHDMSKDEVFDRLVEYLCEWDFKSIIDEHVESEEEIQIGNIIFQLVCSRAWEIKKQGTTTDTLRAERPAAANGAQDGGACGRCGRNLFDRDGELLVDGLCSMCRRDGSQDAVDSLFKGDDEYIHTHGYQKWEENFSGLAVPLYDAAELEVDEGEPEDRLEEILALHVDNAHLTKELDAARGENATLKAALETIANTERQTAANGAQDAVSDGKYKRGDLVLHGSTMYTVADEYVYRSGDELVSHYRVESKGSILDAYYLAEELTPATAIATSELERLRSEHATMLKALTDVRYSGEISYRILDIIDPILKQANQEEG